MSINRHLPYIEEKIHGLRPIEKQILIKIARFSNQGKTGRLNASQETLAQWFSCSVATVRRATRRLEKTGLIDNFAAIGLPNDLRFGVNYWDKFSLGHDIILPKPTPCKMSEGVAQNERGTPCNLSGYPVQNERLPVTTDLSCDQKITDKELISNYKVGGFPSVHYASTSWDAQELKRSIESLLSRLPESAKYFQGEQLPSEVSVFAHSGYRPGGSL